MRKAAQFCGNRRFIDLVHAISDEVRFVHRLQLELFYRARQFVFHGALRHIVFRQKGRGEINGHCYQTEATEYENQMTSQHVSSPSRWLEGEGGARVPEIFPCAEPQSGK